MTELGADLTDDLDYSCPRCTRQVRERVYGPCASCRAELQAAIVGTARDIDIAEYTPKMNVTPNAVATKE
jgi:hypothetical protein